MELFVKKLEEHAATMVSPLPPFSFRLNPPLTRPHRVAARDRRSHRERDAPSPAERQLAQRAREQCCGGRGRPRRLGDLLSQSPDRFRHSPDDRRIHPRGIDRPPHLRAGRTRGDREHARPSNQLDVKLLRGKQVRDDEDAERHGSRTGGHVDEQEQEHAAGRDEAACERVVEHTGLGGGSGCGGRRVGGCEPVGQRRPDGRECR